jgi:hypothetical protein
VQWPFQFTVDFDMGANPVWSTSINLQKFFQVTQEAGFLLIGVSRNHTTYNSASELAPLALDIRDRQSSRQLNGSPIPLQMLGRSSKYTQFHEPLWINPAAYVDLTITSLAPNTTGVNSSAESKFSLTFWGYRMRNPAGVNMMGTSVGKGGAVHGFDHLGALRPANVGTEGTVMWPYFYITTLGPQQYPVVAPGSGLDTYFSVSQEAAFLITHMMSVVYERSGTGPNYMWTALDPVQQPNGTGYAPGLTYNMTDPQSGRVFNYNPTPMDYVGPGDFPSVLQAPMLMLPNTTMITRFQNQHASRVYCPYVCFFGYRLRLSDMQAIQSLTT